MSVFDASQLMFNNPSFYNGVIDQSLRFNDDDSAHLIRTPSSAGDRKTFTISFWIKRANLSTPTPFLFDAYNASTENSFLRFNTDDNVNAISENINWKVNIADSVYSAVEREYHEGNDCLVFGSFITVSQAYKALNQLKNKPEDENY